MTRRPGCNLATLLGGHNGFVDCEGDDEAANALIIDLCRGHDHPMFRSNKSIHHIFKCPDPALTVLKHGGVEFRGSHHISILPPSTHPTGKRYQWLTSPRMPVSEMPLALANWYWEHRPKKWGCGNDGNPTPWCHECKKKFVVRRERFDLEVEAFKKHGQPWACHGCRKIDVRDICKFLKRHRRSRQVGTLIGRHDDGHALLKAGEFIRKVA